MLSKIIFGFFSGSAVNQCPASSDLSIDFLNTLQLFCVIKQRIVASAENRMLYFEIKSKVLVSKQIVL